MRVIAGRYGRRRLAPAPRGIRPTADRVREALFSRLGDVSGAAVLDLFAGTGALGIEALSRGASRVVFVERAAAALATLRVNVAALGLEDECRIARGDAAATVRRLAQAGEQFDLVFLDPPYASDEVVRCAPLLVEHGVLRPGAQVVVESPTRHSLGPLVGLEVVDEREYGETRITTFVTQN